MTRPPKGATALAVPLAELPRLRFAISRLKGAEQANDRARAALHDAQDRRAELARRMADAKADERAKAEGAEQEQTTRRAPTEGVTVTTFGDRGPSGIGVQETGQSYESLSQVTSQALKKYTAAREVVAALQPLLDHLDGVTLPLALTTASEAAEDLQDAKADAKRLELAKRSDAAPVLIAADGEFEAAAHALEAARLAAERVRADLVKTYGEDERFAAKHLALGMSPPMVKLAADFSRSAVGTSGGLLDLHHANFDLEA